MSNTEKGTKFEIAVEKVVRWMYSNYDVVSIQRNVIIDSADTGRQIDVLITITVGDLIFRVAIECKDYTIPLPIGIIDAFVSKLEDVEAHKGIIIASNGFSSAFIRKAKRKNIILYSLSNQIQFNDKELDIPIIIEEVIPSESEFIFSVSGENAKTMKGETLIIEPIIINGFHLYKTLKSNWESMSLKYQMVTVFQDIELSELTPPYRIIYYINETNKLTDEVELSNLTIRIKFKIRYYTIYLKELIGLNVLQNIHENNLRIFIEANTILKSFPNAKPINKADIENLPGTRFVFQLRGDFNIKSIGGSYSAR